MVAITFVIMGPRPAFTAQNPAGVYQLGDIVSAHLTADVPEAPSPNSPLLFVDVPDVPLAAAQRIKRIRDEQLDQDHNLVRRRIWYLDRDLIPATKRQELLQNRRASATWTQFKGVVKRRENETNLTDADFD